MAATPSRTQRLFTSMVDARTAAAMEAHSRAWLVECPGCGFSRSIWDLGGIRYKASGKPSTRLRCSRCGEAGWHTVRKAVDFPVTDAPALPLVRLIVIFTLVLLLAIAGILMLVFWLTGIIRG